MNIAKNNFTIRPLTQADRSWVINFIDEHWGADLVIVHGKIFIPSTLPGFVAERGGSQVGLVTYLLSGSECEIVTLDSLIENHGVGTALLEAVEAAAGENGASRLWLVTTNNNLEALGFYQRRGFRIAEIRKGAVAQAHTLNPNTPQMAESLMPIFDELELEKNIDVRQIHPDGLFSSGSQPAPAKNQRKQDEQDRPPRESGVASGKSDHKKSHSKKQKHN
jgi:DNA-3-methyladenine glycosylase I